MSDVYELHEVVQHITVENVDTVELRAGLLGPQGPQGHPGNSGAYVSATAPTGVVGNYLWVQTGLGPTGTDMTFWVEDGTP